MARFAFTEKLVAGGASLVLLCGALTAGAAAQAPGSIPDFSSNGTSWQTNNGGEFQADFPQALGDSQDVRIPPAAHTYQSDVETVHRLEEDEFPRIWKTSPGAATMRTGSPPCPPSNK